MKRIRYFTLWIPSKLLVVPCRIDETEMPNQTSYYALQLAYWTWQCASSLYRIRVQTWEADQFGNRVRYHFPSIAISLLLLALRSREILSADLFGLIILHHRNLGQKHQKWWLPCLYHSVSLLWRHLLDPRKKYHWGIVWCQKMVWENWPVWISLSSWLLSRCSACELRRRFQYQHINH